MKMRERGPWLFLAVAALVAVAGPACKSDDGSASRTGEAPPAASAETPRQPEGVAAAPTGFGVPISANKCPSAAPGSTTTVKEIGDGVEVTVTASDGSPINDIRQRGVQIVAAAKDPATGGGSAADGLATCPVIIKDMIVTETDVPGGATFTVKPAKPAKLEELKKDTKARAASYVVPK